MRHREQAPTEAAVLARTAELEQELGVGNWRRHRCPSSVVIEVRVNGETIAGPLDAQRLGLIAKYSGEPPGEFDLLGDALFGDIRRVEILATYKP